MHAKYTFYHWLHLQFFNVVLITISQMVKDGEHFFMWPLATGTSFEKCLCVCPFADYFVLLVLNTLSSLYILGISPLSEKELARTPHYVGSHFTLLFLYGAEALSFDATSLHRFSLLPLEVLGVLSRKNLPVAKSWSVFPVIPSSSFKVSGLTWKSLTH